MRSIEFDLDRIVATLHHLGVTYIGCPQETKPYETLSPDQLIIALIESGEPRVEYASISLLMCHPEYAESVSVAVNALPPDKVELLQRHYTAAVYLQRMYWPALTLYLGNMEPLPDFFSAQLGLPAPDIYYGVIGLHELVDRLPPPIDWWGSYLYPIEMLIRFLSFEKSKENNKT